MNYKLVKIKINEMINQINKSEDCDEKFKDDYFCSCSAFKHPTSRSTS